MNESVVVENPGRMWNVPIACWYKFHVAGDGYAHERTCSVTMEYKSTEMDEKGRWYDKFVCPNGHTERAYHSPIEELTPK